MYSGVGVVRWGWGGDGGLGESGDLDGGCVMFG